MLVLSWLMSKLMSKQKNPPDIFPEDSSKSLYFQAMQEMGLEPTRSHPRQILSLMRLPFRHSCASNSDILSQVSSKFKCLFPTKHYFLVIFQQSVYSRFCRSQSNQRLRSSHAGSQLCGSAVHCRLLLTEVQQSVIYRCSYIPWNVREHQHHG